MYVHTCERIDMQFFFFTQVVGGEHHTFALTEGGGLLAFGRPLYGRWPVSERVLLVGFLLAFVLLVSCLALVCPARKACVRCATQVASTQNNATNANSHPLAQAWKKGRRRGGG